MKNQGEFFLDPSDALMVEVYKSKFNRMLIYK